MLNQRSAHFCRSLTTNKGRETLEFIRPRRICWSHRVETLPESILRRGATFRASGCNGWKRLPSDLQRILHALKNLSVHWNRTIRIRAIELQFLRQDSISAASSEETISTIPGMRILFIFLLPINDRSFVQAH